MPPAETAADRLSLGERRRILEAAPLFAGLPPMLLDQLVQHSSLRAHEQGAALYRQGSSPSRMFLIVEGGAFVTIGMQGLVPDGEEEADDPGSERAPLVVQVLGPGDLVADLELVSLLRGMPHRGRRLSEARVITARARVLGIPQAQMARAARAAPVLQERLAHLLVARVAAAQGLAAEALLLKNRGKVRLARLLLQMFDRFGRWGERGYEISGSLSHETLGQALGLTRRSVLDDVSALEDFGAVDHVAEGQSAKMILLSRGRLARIAAVDDGDDGDAEGQWLADVDAALRGGEVAHALDLAMEALRYHRSDRLRHRAVLAALRAGSPDLAESLLARFGFTAAHPDEDIAALEPRLLKERSFLAEEAADALELARRSAAGYRAIFERTGGFYPAVNAASMMRLAGEKAEAERLARRVPPAAGGHAGYWMLASAAEAHGLMGDAAAAAAAITAAVAAPDATPGAMATTIRQLRRLARAGAVEVSAALERLAQNPVLFLPGPAGAAADAAGAPSLVVLECGAVADIAAAEAIARRVPLVLVLQRPFEAILRAAPALDRPAWEARVRALSPLVSRVHGPAATPDAAARLGLGLAIHEAWQREAPLLVDEGRGAPMAVMPAGRLLDMAGVAWALPDLLPAGTEAVVTLDAQDRKQHGGLAAFAAGWESTGRLDLGHDVPLWRFANVSTAVGAALELGDHLRARALGFHVACDVAAAGGVSRLAAARPAGEPGGVFATEAFMAECALFPRPQVHVRAVGRVRSLSGLERLGMYRLSRYRHARLGLDAEGRLPCAT